MGKNLQINDFEIEISKINLLYYINAQGNKCKSIHKASDFEKITFIKSGQGFYHFLCSKKGWKPTYFIATISL